MKRKVASTSCDDYCTDCLIDPTLLRGGEKSMCQWETLGPRAGQGLSWSVAQSSWTWAHTPALSSTFMAVTQAPTLSCFLLLTDTHHKLRGLDEFICQFCRSKGRHGSWVTVKVWTGCVPAGSWKLVLASSRSQCHRLPDSAGLGEA